MIGLVLFASCLDLASLHTTLSQSCVSLFGSQFKPAYRSSTFITKQELLHLQIAAFRASPDLAKTDHDKDKQMN